MVHLQRHLVVTCLMPRQIAVVSSHVLCAPCNYVSVYSVTSFEATYVGQGACVTGHLRFWQDDRDLLQATAVTRVWNGYLNKRQHRQLTLERKTPNQDVSIKSHELYHSPYNIKLVILQGTAISFDV